jgi:hypothetical protein
MSNLEIEWRKADGIKGAMWRLNRGGERMTEMHDLNRAIRPFSVKHDPGELFFNDPVTVFHIRALLEIAARPVRYKVARPPHEPDPVDHGIRMVCGKNFPIHRVRLENGPPFGIHLPVLHVRTPSISEC